MGGRGRNGRLRRRINPHIVHVLVHMLTCTTTQPERMYPCMLRFVSDFLGKIAQRDERRLADARAQSFKKWV
eukprot:1871338-Pyramimonas_sp.AAC.1